MRAKFLWCDSHNHILIPKLQGIRSLPERRCLYFCDLRIRKVSFEKLKHWGIWGSVFHRPLVFELKSNAAFCVIEMHSAKDGPNVTYSSI